MRILGVVRQSKRKEQSESPAVQMKAIQSWADLHGHTIVGWASDVGVSASVSPFKRPELGPWLNHPHLLAEWDGLAGWKVDRLVRSTWHFYGELMPELQKLNKHAMAVTEGIDTATSSALEIGLRVMMAQEELDKIRDRARGTREGLRAAAKWHGGIPGFGHYSIKTDEGYKLAIDEDALTWIMVAKDRLANGSNPNQIARYFNQEQVMTAWDRHAVRMGRKPKGILWDRTKVVSMLSSVHLLGQWRQNKGTKKEPRWEIIRGADGTPLKYGEALLSRAEWDELQALLDRPKEVHRRAVSSPLLRVLFCNGCGRPWYYRTPQGREKGPHYYCSSKVKLIAKDQRDCSGGRFPAEVIEALVEQLYLDRFGDEEIVIARAKARVDYASLISELDERIANLATSLGVLKPGGAAHTAVIGELTKAEAERDELVSASEATQGIEYEETGKTYGQEWAEADQDGRLALLRKHKVYVMVQKATDEVPNYIGLGMGDMDYTYTEMTWR